MSVRQKVKELKEALRGEYGVEADIGINIYTSKNKLTYEQAEQITKGLETELGGETYFSEGDLSCFFSNGASLNIADFAIFLPKSVSGVK